MKAADTFQCLLCLEEHEFNGKGYESDLGLCCLCAQEVTVSFCLAHGVPPEAYLQTDPAAYRKKKIGPGLRMRVFERDDFTCKHCGARKNLCADHVVPEVHGGETTLDNLQTLCRSCNSSKGAKTPEEWRGADHAVV